MPKGIAFAVPVALRRGHVMVFIPSLLNLAEFLITGNGWFVMVRVRLARKIYASIAEIEAEFRDAIAGLRLVSRNGPVSCELWLYSRYGTLRHFRVGDAGLVEIDCYGTLPGQVNPAVIVISPRGENAPAVKGPVAAGPAVPGTPDKRNPILRWLAKRNAAMKAGGGADPSGSTELKKILDAGGPGTKPKPAAGKKPVRKGGTATGPDDPGKNPGPEEPVSGANPKAGKKPGNQRTGAAVPADTPDPGRPVPEETPASPADRGSVPGEHPSDRTPGSREHSREEPDPPVPGRNGEVF
jgi:hypothetical protein